MLKLGFKYNINEIKNIKFEKSLLKKNSINMINIDFKFKKL